MDKSAKFVDNLSELCISPWLFLTCFLLEKIASNLSITSTSKSFPQLLWINFPHSLPSSGTMGFCPHSRWITYQQGDTLKSYPCARWISYPRIARSSDCFCMVIPIAHEIIHHSYMLVPTLSTAVQPVDKMSTGCTATLQADSSMKQSNLGRFFAGLSTYPQGLLLLWWYFYNY